MFSAMEPTNSKYVNDTWYEICDTAAWKKMMTRVNQGLSPYESEDEDITLGVAGAGTATKDAGGTTSASETGTSSSESAETDYSGSVAVLNGAGVSGLAGRIAATLDNQGLRYLRHRRLLRLRHHEHPVRGRCQQGQGPGRGRHAGAFQRRGGRRHLLRDRRRRGDPWRRHGKPLANT